MHPRPQYLANDLKAATFTAPELFRIVKAGVRYSAMPSWPADRRDDEIWHMMVAITRRLDDRQIDAVAAYYAAQPPATVQSFAAVRPPSASVPARTSTSIR